MIERFRAITQEHDFVAIDTETTGLSPLKGDRICEIAVARFRGPQLVDLVSQLIDPQREISAGAARVHGITEDMLQGKPTLDKVAPHVMREIRRGRILVGHNVDFDLRFLAHQLRDRFDLLGLEVADTMKLGAPYMPGGKWPKLPELATALGVAVPDGLHRAAQDAVLAGQCFWALLHRGEIDESVAEAIRDRAETYHGWDLDDC
jgi:DNA polymerase-3 subunit epsilon